MRTSYLKRFEDPQYGRPLSEVLVIAPRAGRSKTHLGNSMLHKNKSVMVESVGGVVPRAKVMDQTLIDKYLMKGFIDLNQHMAGEYLLDQARKMGVWPVGANLSGTGGRGSRQDYSLLRGHGLGNALAGVAKRYGWFHRYLLLEVVVHDWDVSDSEMRMGVLREGLDHVFQHRVGGTARGFVDGLKGATGAAPEGGG